MHLYFQFNQLLKQGVGAFYELSILRAVHSAICRILQVATFYEIQFCELAILRICILLVSNSATCNYAVWADPQEKYHKECSKGTCTLQNKYARPEKHTWVINYYKCGEGAYEKETRYTTHVLRIDNTQPDAQFSSQLYWVFNARSGDRKYAFRCCALLSQCAHNRPFVLTVVLWRRNKNKVLKRNQYPNALGNVVSSIKKRPIKISSKMQQIVVGLGIIVLTDP